MPVESDSKMRDNDDFGISDNPPARTPSSSSSEEDIAGIQAFAVAEQMFGPEMENGEIIITMSSSDEEDQELIIEEEEEEEDEDDVGAAAAAPEPLTVEPSSTGNAETVTETPKENETVEKKDASTSPNPEAMSSGELTPEHEVGYGLAEGPATKDASTFTDFEFGKDEETEDSEAKKQTAEKHDDYKSTRDLEPSSSSAAALSPLSTVAASGSDPSVEAVNPRKVTFASVAVDATASSTPVTHNGGTEPSGISRRVLGSPNQHPLLMAHASPRVLHWIEIMDRATYNLQHVPAYDRMEILLGRELLIHWLVRNWSIRGAIPEEQALMQQLLHYESGEDEDDVNRELPPEHDDHHDESDEDDQHILQAPKDFA